MKAYTSYESFSSVLREIGISEPIFSTLVERYENDIIGQFGIRVFEYTDKYIVSFSIDGYVSIDPCTIIFTKEAEQWNYVEHYNYDVKEISEDFSIYEINDYEIICNDAKGTDYYRVYWPITEQGLINNHGDIIYKGDLGDSDKIQIIDDYLLLEKDKFTSKQKEQISYYLDNILTCQNNEKFREKTELMASLDFEQVFDLKEVANGKYINTTIEEYNFDYSEMNDEEDELWWNSCHEIDEMDYTVYTEVKSYSVIDLKNQRQLFPFQPCKIRINPSGKKGIYLLNEIDLKTNSNGYRYNPKEINEFHSKFEIDSDDNHYFYGQVFYSASDTFRAGDDTGISIARLFKQKPKTVIKYVLSNDIFISTKALLQLVELFEDSHLRTICQLVSARERCFSFEMVYSSHDKIKSHYVILANNRCEVSIFHGKTLREILSHNPQYLISLIDSNYYFIHPDAIKDLDDLPCYKRLYESVNDVFEYRQADWEWRREMEDIRSQREFNRMEIETGWNTAFGDDPESEWNID